MTGDERIKQQILKEYDRLDLDDTFTFACHDKVSCFNSCCGDVNIALTPYDVIRLKHRLELSSSEFIKRYTLRPFTKDQELPVVLLKMRDEEERKPCHFVTEQGCGVYEDRPWPCRMYPVGRASARTDNDPDAPEFFFLLKEDHCKGFGEAKTWTIRQWLDNQGVAEYDEAGELFKEINLHPYFRQGGSLNPQQMEMYFLASYDLDRFRAFVLQSSFLQKYHLEPEVVEAIKDDDMELFRLGVRWLRTCLFSENLIPIKDDVREKYKQRLAEQGKKVK